MPNRRWMADPAAGLLWRSWGDAHFAFDPRSGQTHFLNSVAVEVYHLLEGGGLEVGEIYQALLARYDIDDDEALRQLQALAAAEAKPALRALVAAARARGVPAHADDDMLSIGEGVAAQAWPLGPAA